MGAVYPVTIHCIKRAQAFQPALAALSETLSLGQLAYSITYLLIMQAEKYLYFYHKFVILSIAFQRIM